MEKKLSKTEKIKRLMSIKNCLKGNDCFMCHIYENLGFGDLFKDIPELLRFKPKTHECNYNSEAWVYTKERNDCSNENMPTYIKRKKQAIDKAIKLIQSK